MNVWGIITLCVSIWLCTDYASAVTLLRFEPESTLCRAGRPEAIVLSIENRTENSERVTYCLDATAEVSLAPRTGELLLAPFARATLQATAEATGPCISDLTIRMANSMGLLVVTNHLRIAFLEKKQPRKLDYIPDPEPVETDLLIGAHHCPLWEKNHPEMWSQLSVHPERMPALGFYEQENPEVSDWETKWAVEHGISFFIYCWYRTQQGGPVEMKFGSAIHDAFFHSRFQNKMKFTIMWENQVQGSAGVSGEKDLFDNLFPFWMNTYFKHPSYLKVDNKPVLFIYRPDYLIRDLGSETAVAAALDKMRVLAKKEGFDGLTILGEYRGVDPAVLTLFKRLGLDYTFAYCWHVQNSPPPEGVIEKQLAYITQTEALNILPQVITVSQAWSGWRDEGSIWKLPPDDFRTLLQKVKPIVARQPVGSLGKKMLLLDNWNEWGEGHYIAPYREYGFGYLDAVRDVFGKNHPLHDDLLPTDIGRGPYDATIRAQRREQETRDQHCRQRMRKDAAHSSGLLAWWAFDEPKDAIVFDVSGNRQGGVMHHAVRSTGIDGSALVCTGGCVEVACLRPLTLTTQMTVSCWIKTECANQTQAWIVNRIQGGGEKTGFRLGLMNGKLVLNIPVSNWSHLVSARIAVPLSRWTHVAGTYDGQMMRVYQDGQLMGEYPRTGPVYPNAFPLYLGSFAKNHSAHFTGVLDEVKLYDRARQGNELLEEVTHTVQRFSK